MLRILKSHWLLNHAFTIILFLFFFLRGSIGILLHQLHSRQYVYSQTCCDINRNSVRVLQKKLASGPRHLYRALKSLVGPLQRMGHVLEAVVFSNPARKQHRNLVFDMFTGPCDLNFIGYGPFRVEISPHRCERLPALSVKLLSGFFEVFRYVIYYFCCYIGDRIL